MALLDKALAQTVRVTPRPIVRQISRRYIAGDTLGDAVNVIRDLNAQGCVATVDVLGESITRREQAVATLEEYTRVLAALDEHGLRAGVSVKLTALGLVLDPQLCRAQLEEIVRHADRHGRFVRVDMEDSPYTGATLDMVLDLHERCKNVGVVIQAYMRRSLEDVQRLNASKVSVRLTKGIYDEPRRLAFKDFDVVRENFVFLLEELLRGGCHVGIATHDEYLVWHALRLVHQLGLGRGRYEFQMLLGVDEELRSILVECGHRVRVYVPYGKDWYAYSTRRLQENPKIAGYVARAVLASPSEFLSGALDGRRDLALKAGAATASLAAGAVAGLALRSSRRARD
jgi:proline dehydrogenase